MEINHLDEKLHFYNNLNERQKRHFVAIIAKDLGHGGQLFASSAFNIEADTVRKGWTELILKEVLTGNRIRKEGGGRKKNFIPATYNKRVSENSK